MKLKIGQVVRCIDSSRARGLVGVVSVFGVNRETYGIRYKGWKYGHDLDRGDHAVDGRWHTANELEAILSLAERKKQNRL